MKLTTPELVGETTVKEKIWEHLFGDKVFKIAVCGMGGIGKTTIMKHIHNELLKKTKFTKVIWVTVSKEFDVVKLQENIAYSLGVDLSKEKDETRRAAALSKMLEERKRHVLILDDVWNDFCLEDVGIPEPTFINGCKLILTTRSKDVARSMSCEVIEVKPLSKAEALNLFLNKVGHEMLLIPTLESTLKQVVEQCAGLPLAIVTIATSLKGENDVKMWQNALEELKVRVGSVQGMADRVLERLKFSYERLTDETLKLCFLYCGLYPEDWEIKKELIEYWIAEGYIDKMVTRQQMHYKGHAILKRFENNCLLESVQDGRCVKMHDLIRDMALHITSQNPRYLIKAGMALYEPPNEQEWRKDVEKVSLMGNLIEKITLEMTLPLPNSTTLSTLFRQHSFCLREIHESFFKLMIGLKVLDLSYTSIKHLPNSISNLENLVALLLHGCFSLTNVPSLEKLGALKKLDLGGTAIENIPEGLEMLVNITYLDLNSYYLKEMPGRILIKLSNLQHLSLDDTLEKVDDVASFKKLGTLGLRFYNLQDYHLYLSQRPTCLNNYIFNVGDTRKLSFGTSYRKTVEIRGCRICGELLVLPTDVQALGIQRCNDVRSLSDIPCLKDATELRTCWIYLCEQMESLFYSPFCCTTLTSIEELHLDCLNNLSILLGEERHGAISTLPTPTTPGIFSRLQIVEIIGCPKLQSVFLPELIPHLQNLKRITFYGCSRLVKIVGGSESGEYDDEENKEARKNYSITLHLPMLTSIKLYYLPELESFCNSRYAIVCNSLETICISNCPKLKRMSPLLPRPDNGQPFPPPSLQEIEIYPKQTWDSLEWDDSNTKDVLESFLRLY